jgi:hypothetical protein
MAATIGLAVGARSADWWAEMMMRWSACLVVLLVAVLTGACNGLPSLPSIPGLPPNPFAAAPTVVEEPPTPPPGSPTPLPTATPVPFTPFWVKNFKTTEMWSGPAGQPGVISFGTTSQQFCAFQVVRPQDGSRLYVLNPYSRDYFWIDADAVGPVPDAPPRAGGPKPPDQNCTDQLYDS